MAWGFLFFPVRQLFSAPHRADGPLALAALLCGVFVLFLGSATGCRHRPTSTSEPAAVAAPAELPPLDSRTVEAQARYMSAVISRFKGDDEAALKEFSEAASAQPADNALALEVSAKLLSARKLDVALEVLTRTAAQPGVSGDVLARLASVQATSGRTNEAVATARRALTSRPGSPEATRTLFLLLAREKNFEAARGVVDRAFAQTNLPPEFLVGLSEMYVALGQAQSAQRDASRTNALDALRRALATKPSNPDLRNKIADGFFLLGEPEQASQIYLDLLKQYPDNEVVRTSVRAKLIETYLRGKDRSQAVEQLEATIRDNPGNAQAYFVLGDILSEQHDWEKAADHYGKAVLFNPAFEPAYYALALAQINTDDLVGALRTLAKAKERFGETFSFEFVSGMAETTRSNYTAAIKHLTAAEIMAGATDPERLNERLFFQLGAVHERVRNYDQAAKYFERAIAAEPEFAEAMNYLGYMWAERGENLERAHQLLTKALSLQPDNPAYLDSLAWVLFKQGKPAEALPHMEKSIALTEKPDPTLYDHLGDIQSALGQPAKARAAWQRAAELDPGNEQIRAKLGPEKRD
jgi:tetratricopeptide (TPR) repeat protein